MNEDEHANDLFGIYWAKACEDFIQRLYAYALRLANGKRYDADDLVQETICRALTYSKNPEGIRSPLGYLLRMMRNIWVTKWHTENTAKMESLDELESKASRNHPTVEPDVFRLLENEELAIKLRTLPGRLTPHEQELLKLYLEGYTCLEMAGFFKEDVRVTRADLNAVKNKVAQRIRRSMKQHKG